MTLFDTGLLRDPRCWLLLAGSIVAYWLICGAILLDCWLDGLLGVYDGKRVPLWRWLKRKYRRRHPRRPPITGKYESRS